MKLDTEETIRVTVTIRRESNPEWHALLSSIKSGRARAEIVRSHLTIPSENRFHKSDSPPASELQKQKPVNRSSVNGQFFNSSPGTTSQRGSQEGIKEIRNQQNQFENDKEIGVVDASENKGRSLASTLIKDGTSGFEN